jgi:hypothetical protein
MLACDQGPPIAPDESRMSLFGRDFSCRSARDPAAIAINPA